MFGGGKRRRAGAPVRAAMLGDRSKPMVAPAGLALTRRRNISPLPVATSSTFMPSRTPERLQRAAVRARVEQHGGKRIDRRQLVVDAPGPLGQRDRQPAGGPLAYQFF